MRRIINIALNNSQQTAVAFNCTKTCNTTICSLIRMNALDTLHMRWLFGFASLPYMFSEFIWNTTHYDKPTIFNMIVLAPISCIQYCIAMLVILFKHTHIFIHHNILWNMNVCYSYVCVLIACQSITTNSMS